MAAPESLGRNTGPGQVGLSGGSGVRAGGGGRDRWTCLREGQLAGLARDSDIPGAAAAEAARAASRRTRRGQRARPPPQPAPAALPAVAAFQVFGPSARKRASASFSTSTPRPSTVTPGRGSAAGRDLDLRPGRRPGGGSPSDRSLPQATDLRRGSGAVSSSESVTPLSWHPPEAPRRRCH